MGSIVTQRFMEELRFFIITFALQEKLELSHLFSSCNNLV